MKSHLKRLIIPNTWPLTKKSDKYVIRPFPSKSFDESMPLSIVFRDVLKISKTAKETKNILMNSYIFVDGVRRTDIKHTMGLLDTLEIKGTSDAYRMVLTKKGKLTLIPVKESELKTKPMKVIKKTIMKKGLFQLNLIGGYNSIVDKDEAKVGDSLMLSMPDKKITKVLPLKEGAYVYLIGGSHVGRHGKVTAIEKGNIAIKSGSEELKTSKRYAYVVGEDKPLITLSVD